MVVKATVVQPKPAPVVMKEEQVKPKPPKHELTPAQVEELKRVLEISGADSFSQIQTLAKIRLIVEV